MDIPVSLLNAFVVFNDSANISEAASRLGVTQPALSKQLRRLEDSLPAPVFIQTGRKKTLTPFGRDLHQRLKTRLGDLRDVVRDSWTMHASPAQSTIRIAGRRGLLDRMSTKLKFEGTLIFQESSNDEVMQSLRSLEADIGIMHRIPETHELTVKPLFREDFVLAVPKNFLPSPPTLGPALMAKLRELPCLGYKPDDAILKSFCDFHGVDLASLRMTRATESYPSLGEMAEARFGWGVLPAALNLSEARCWLLPIPAKMLPARHFSVVYRPEFASVPWFKELIGDIRRCFEKEIR